MIHICKSSSSLFWPQSFGYLRNAGYQNIKSRSQGPLQYCGEPTLGEEEERKKKTDINEAKYTCNLQLFSWRKACTIWLKKHLEKRSRQELRQCGIQRIFYEPSFCQEKAWMDGSHAGDFSTVHPSPSGSETMSQKSAEGTSELCICKSSLQMCPWLESVLGASLCHFHLCCSLRIWLICAQ